MARTPQELEDALAEQVSALASSCKAFDAGDQWEAKRLATTLYTLLHDGGRNSRSLLGQIGRKEILYTSSCCGVNDSNLQADEPLTLMWLSSVGAVHLPIKAEIAEVVGGYKQLKFGKWWDEAVFKDMSKRRLSRKNLIFSLRSQEGGSHFDHKVRDAVYKGYKEGQGSGWTFSDGKGAETFVAGGPLATMRQIAWEVADTFVRNDIGDSAKLQLSL